MRAIPSIFEMISTKFNRKSPINKLFNAKAHCSVKSHHDFYCEAERPYNAIQTSK